MSRTDSARWRACRVSPSGAAGASREAWAGALKTLIALSISPKLKSIRLKRRGFIPTLYFKRGGGGGGGGGPPPPLFPFRPFFYEPHTAGDFFFFSFF